MSVAWPAGAVSKGAHFHHLSSVFHNHFQLLSTLISALSSSCFPQGSATYLPAAFFDANHHPAPPLHPNHWIWEPPPLLPASPKLWCNCGLATCCSRVPAPYGPPGPFKTSRQSCLKHQLIVISEIPFKRNRILLLLSGPANPVSALLLESTIVFLRSLPSSILPSLLTPMVSSCALQESHSISSNAFAPIKANSKPTSSHPSIEPWYNSTSEIQPISSARPPATILMSSAPLSTVAALIPPPIASMMWSQSPFGN